MDTAVSRARILVVDDQQPNVLLLEHVLADAGFTNVISTTDSSRVAAMCAEDQPDLVLLDLQMPQPDGFEVMQQLEPFTGTQPRLPILVLTADHSSETKRRALSMGASDFLNKPFDVIEVVLRIRNLLLTRLLQLELGRQNAFLEERVRERTHDLEQARLEILQRLALAAEYRDDETYEHTQRVAETAGLLAEQLGCSEHEISLIRQAAPLHDIGKLGISDTILLKPGPLTSAEFDQIRGHTTAGAAILGGSHSDVLQLAAEVALAHHEWWDGTGYPDGLKGEMIPFSGRVVALADVFDALTHARPYKQAWPIDQAVAEIHELGGRQFDPAIVEAFDRLDPYTIASQVGEAGEPSAQSPSVRTATSRANGRALTRDSASSQATVRVRTGLPDTGLANAPEAIFRSLAHHTPVGIFVSNADGRCEYVNGRWCELTGLTPEQALGDGWAAAIHPDDAARVRAEWAEASQAGRDSIVEYRFLRPDGTTCWIQGFAAAHRDENGVIAGWVGTCLDLTARIEAEEALLDSSERFRVAFDNAPIGVALLTPDGRWFHVNSALCELLGYTAEELYQRTFQEITHPEDLEVNLDRNRQQLAGGEWEKRIEKRYIRSDGEAVWVALSNEVVFDPDGNPLYFVAHIEDVTHRRQTEGALRDAEERFRRAFEDAPIGMSLVACDGRFLRVNRTLSEITGYSTEELLARSFQDITHPDDLGADLDQAERLLADEIRAYQMEKRYRRADGSIVWVMISVSLVRDGSGQPLYFVAQIEDITARRHAAEELQDLADHDWLTGLLNRRRFTEELQRELKRLARRPDRTAALLILDVDRFKDVNDSLGHRAGDEVLRSVAETLLRRLRASDVVSRIGGDEFAALVVDLNDDDEARTIADDIADAIRSQTILTPVGTTDITVSIGVVALGAHHAGHEDQALITADNAMYQAKRNGRNQIALAA